MDEKNEKEIGIKMENNLFQLAIKTLGIDADFSKLFCKKYVPV